MRKVPERNLLQYPHVTGQNMTKLNVCMLAAVEPRAVTAEAMAPNRHRWHRRLEDRMANSAVTSTSVDVSPTKHDGKCTRIKQGIDSWNLMDFPSKLN